MASVRTESSPVRDRHVVYIGIGSNIGDRIDHCEQAMATLDGYPDCHIESRSSFYETEPVGLEDQRWFVNAVACLHTILGPYDLFGRLQKIEQTMGREKIGPRNGPRILDLDILFYDALVFRMEDLEIPHPRAHERRFVLQPFCDLAPDFVHPVLGKTARSLLKALKDGKKVLVL